MCRHLYCVTEAMFQRWRCIGNTGLARARGDRANKRSPTKRCSRVMHLFPNFYHCFSFFWLMIPPQNLKLEPPLRTTNKYRTLILLILNFNIMLLMNFVMLKNIHELVKKLSTFLKNIQPWPKILNTLKKCIYLQILFDVNENYVYSSWITILK